MVSDKTRFTCEICGKMLSSGAGLAGHKQFAHGQAKHMLAATPEAAIVELLSELADAFSRLEERADAQANQVKALESMLARTGQHLDGFRADLMERLAVEQAGHERAEERANRAEELASSHPEPDQKLLEVWSRCSNCRPKLKDFYSRLYHTIYPSLGKCTEVHLKEVAADQDTKRQAEAASEAWAESSEQLKEAKTQRWLIVCGGYRGGFKWSNRLSSLPGVPDGIEGEDCGYYKVVEDATEVDKYKGKGSFRVIELESVEEIVSGPEVEA